MVSVLSTLVSLDRLKILGGDERNFGLGGGGAGTTRATFEHFHFVFERKLRAVLERSREN